MSSLPNGVSYQDIKERPLSPKDWTHLNRNGNKTDTSYLNPLRGRTIEHEEARPMEYEEDFGTFHAKSAEISEQNNVIAFCGNLAIRWVVSRI